MTADALVTGTGAVALLATLLGTWLVLWLLAGMLGVYLRLVYAEDDAGSGRWKVR